MTKPSILNAILGQRAERQQGGKRSRQEAIVLAGDIPVAGDSRHYNGMKTTYDATGAVQIGSYETIASAWALHSFLPDDCGYGDMSGIWIMLSHDTCFRAGEGVWLTPSSFMPRPRIKLQG